MDLDGDGQVTRDEIQKAPDQLLFQVGFTQTSRLFILGIFIFFIFFLVQICFCHSVCLGISSPGLIYIFILSTLNRIPTEG